MLILSAILSIALVATVYYNYKQQRSPVMWASIFAGATTIGAVLLVCIMPALWLHCVAVLIGVQFWTARRGSAQSLLVYMIVALVPSYGLSVYYGIQRAIERNRLIEQNAFESMEARVPDPKRSAPLTLSVVAQKQLTELEARLNQEDGSHRRFLLERLHQSSLKSFIDSPGFGAMRHIEPDESSLRIWGRDETPVSQPGVAFSSTTSETELATAPRAIEPDALREMHLTGVLDFVNPGGFGWVVSRQKVAGFRPHQFRATPRTERLATQSVELVGLLMRDDPVVYISDKLPGMKDAKKLPTRLLNTFEATGLQKLRQGDDLFIRETSEGIRMLGAVRSIEQCVKCHGGERGDLLGAFSYSLARVP